MAINDVLGDNQKALNIVNRTPLFWLTISGALETSFFIALTRIFDRDSRTHNIGRLLKIVKSNIDFFSFEALKTRKIKDPNAHEWIDEYMKDVYVPNVKDFQRLEKYVDKYRNISKTYSNIRHKVFGHKERLNNGYILKLYSQTNIIEVEKLLIFMLRLYRAFWQLFHNGRKPILIPMRYSVKRMRKIPLPEWQRGSVQEKIVDQAQKFFDILSTKRRVESTP
ncbi:MAG: AbiU2 domain-containing protein [Desulfobaccales bacterium]